ncbi:uncharacterized protein LOC130690930 [Daphnia carinata]|uniref:uncharacterized protein LOC130690930 n=1 Tax=Daphnia carinata TaxID=120202 RepID=UPI00257ADE46|nr:uncharacterized protein LOC130690930 [Daphnia carinata]XP_057369785.1 uncharacterized protein LOC130690930 [Daphnia carinata]XP_059350914.1 uncharacterized protein LOC130690930 [Daphnia carinata]
MVSCSTSQLWMIRNRGNTSERGPRLSRSTSVTATRRIKMLVVAQTVFLLVTGAGLQMVSSAPTPAHSDVTTVAGQANDSSLLTEAKLMDIVREEGNKSTAIHLGHEWWRKGEVEEPPDIRSRNDRQYFTNSKTSPGLYTINKNDVHHAGTPSALSSSQPSIMARTNTTRIVKEENLEDMIFNIVIQKERADKSAFIAPDVNWLRDLVPKVVDVADKPETLIKETIVNAIDGEHAVEIEQIKDRRLFVNVVKSEIGSDVEVPDILARLSNLMKTGGPAVESILLESRDIAEPENSIYVINIIIFNIVVLEAPVEKPVFVKDKVSNIEQDITEDSYLVALRESQQNRLGSSPIGRHKNPSPAIALEDNQSRTPDSAIAEDSYIVALRESQKNRNKSSSPSIHHHHHHEEKHPHTRPHHVVVEKVSDQQFNGHYLTEVPTYAYASTARPLMAMEKDYLRRFTIKPTQPSVAVEQGQPMEEQEQPIEEQEQDEVDQSAAEQGLLTNVQEHLPTLLVDPNASLEFVNLPTGPYFTNPSFDVTQIVSTEPSSIEKPPEIEAVVVDVAQTAGNNHIRVTTKKPVTKKPLIVRVPEAVGVMTNKATNIVRNRIRTVGLFGIPMMVGLASTVNSWLPTVTALGRRRRKRSITEVDDWQDNHRHTSRAIEVAQVLARLMGKRYTDASKESHQQSVVDNQEYGDQEWSSASTMNSKNEARANRRKWFPFRRTGNTRVNSERRPSTRRATFARKMKDLKSNTRKYMTPLFYTTFFANEDSPNVMEHDQSITSELQNETLDDVEPQQATEDVMEHRENVVEDQEAIENVVEDQEAIENVIERAEVVEGVMEHREVIKDDAQSTDPMTNSAVGPPVEYDDYQPEEVETKMADKIDDNPEEEFSQMFPALNPPSGFDFDIVSNFVRAMMMNNEEYDDGPPETREEVFWVKEATIVNTTQTVSSKPQKFGGSSMLLLKPSGGPTRLTSSGINGSTVSVFSADPLMPNYINNENVTNSPITYVSVKSPTKVTWLGVGPPDVITSSTQSSSSAENDPTGEINDEIPLDLPPSEVVGAPLQFYDEETDNYVSKEVPSIPGPPTVSYYTERTPSTDRTPSNDITSEQSSVIKIQEITKPARPVSTDLRPGLSSLLLTIASFNRPRLPPPVEVSNNVSTIKYTIGQGFATQPQSEYNGDTTDKYTHGHGIVSKPDDVSKYTHGHGIIVTNAPTYEFNSQVGESSLLSSSSDNNNVLSNLIKGTGASENDGPTTPTLLGETSIQFVGMYGGTSVDSTVGPFTATGISDSEELDSTLDDLITQLQANMTTGLVSTDRPLGGIHFTNTSTDIVIINPFVTPSSVFPQLQVEAIEAEDGDTFGSIDDTAIDADDTIVVDAQDGDQPDSVPNVSNLANLFFTSSGSSSSSAGSSGSSGVSNGGGGVSGDSVSSSTANPIALFYTFGLAAVGILALTLPLWVPFVVAKMKRRTYAPSKTYPASKKKPTYGYPSSPPKKTYAEPPPNHYQDLDEEELYGNEHYLDQHQVGSVLSQPQYQSTTIEDLYRPSVGDVLSTNSDDHYIFRDSIALNPEDDMFHNPGPLSSETIYGSPARIYLKARRKRSSRFKRSNKR